MIRETVKSLVQQVPAVAALVRQRDELINERQYLLDEIAKLRAAAATWVPPGHYYSPIVDVSELHRRRAVVFDRTIRPTGVDLNEGGQLEFLQKMSRHYEKLPFKFEKTANLRYYYDNEYFSYSDAIVLACLLMEVQPRRIVEIGSGYSSSVMMDINERFFGEQIAISFIDPCPDRLLNLMKPRDKSRYTVIASQVQDIDIATIDQLQAGDVLFIDSTHVSKCGSDVNFEFFTILPRLASGVYIHFHDIFYPFEYPEYWFFDENRSWNEAYLMRAFLTNNTNFEIIFFNHFMACSNLEDMRRTMPLFCQNIGGGFWIRKL